MTKDYRIKARNIIPNDADLTELSHEELADLADQGQRGQGAIIEMDSRLKKSIDNLSKVTSLYSKILIGLTICLVILTVVLVILTYFLFSFAYR